MKAQILHTDRMVTRWPVVIVRFAILLLVAMVLNACSKFLEVDKPIGSVDTEQVFNNEQTAEAAINGIYSKMLQSPMWANSATSLFTGLSADELHYYTPGVYDGFEQNKITLPDQLYVETRFWTPMYQYIYSANAIIEGLENSTIAAVKKTQLTAEAKFIRAFCYFHLVNLFGKVPLVTTTQYTGNSALGRESKEVIYQQITGDLQSAIKDLPDQSPAERTRPGKPAAQTLLAKVSLYLEKWEDADRIASEVIGSGAFNLTTPEKTFLNTSAETIWQLKPIDELRNTYEAWDIIPATAQAMPTWLIREDLYNSFDKEDLRKSLWIATRSFGGETLYYPFKYRERGGAGKPLTEYYIVLRLADLILIRAEARAHLNNTSGAVADINIIRKRAGFGDDLITDDISAADLLLAIENERRLELFAEWGNRWFDLKRTGRADKVLGSAKAGWSADAALWPVPESEILKNKNLLPQNPGY